MMGKDPTECVRLFNSARAAAGSVPFYNPSTMVQGTGGTFLNPNEFGGYNALVLMGDVTPTNMNEAGVPTGVMGVSEAAALLQGVGGAGIAQGEQVERLATFFGQVWGGMSQEGMLASNEQALHEGLEVFGGFSPLALVGVQPRMRDWNNPAEFGTSTDLTRLMPQLGDFTAVGGSEQDFAEWQQHAAAMSGPAKANYTLGMIGGAVATAGWNFLAVGAGEPTPPMQTAAPASRGTMMGRMRSLMAQDSPGVVTSLKRWWYTGAENDAAWRALSAKDKLYYEIGQNTLTDAEFQALAQLSPVARGRILVQQRGWFGASFGSSYRTLPRTMGTGPTPAARYFLPRAAIGAGAAAGGAAAYYYLNK